METTRIGELTGLEARPPGNERGRVLMVHGWWGGAWVWDRFLERFAARGYHCWAINLRGHHGSKAVADIGKISFEDHLGDLREAVHALGQPAVVTHSAGGLLSLKLGEELSLPACVNLVPTAPKGYFSLRTLRVFLPHLGELLRGKPVLLDKASMFDADLNRLPPEEQEEVYSRMVPASGKQGADMLNVAVDPARVTGPRLIISGTEDRLIPPTIHHKLAADFGAEYREYPNRGHYLMREPGWEVVADDIMHWLERVGVASQHA
jgi:pimeloyl-ACP methyl ester carboxylesterase